MCHVALLGDHIEHPGDHIDYSQILITTLFINVSCNNLWHIHCVAEKSAVRAASSSRHLHAQAPSSESAQYLPQPSQECLGVGSIQDDIIDEALTAHSVSAIEYVCAHEHLK